MPIERSSDNMTPWPSRLSSEYRSPVLGLHMVAWRDHIYPAREGEQSHSPSRFHREGALGVYVGDQESWPLVHSSDTGVSLSERDLHMGSTAAEPLRQGFLLSAPWSTGKNKSADQAWSLLERGVAKHGCFVDRNEVDRLVAENKLFQIRKQTIGGDASPLSDQMS